MDDYEVIEPGVAAGCFHISGYLKGCACRVQSRTLHANRDRHAGICVQGTPAYFFVRLQVQLVGCLAV